MLDAIFGHPRLARIYDAFDRRPTTERYGWHLAGAHGSAAEACTFRGLGAGSQNRIS